MVRECQFIKADGRVWVPSPSSWLGGWARHRWLERHFGDNGVLGIASSESWGRLYSENDVYVLVEDSGKYTEKLIKSIVKDSSQDVKKEKEDEAD